MHLTDGDRIRSLLGDYCRLVDTADFAGVGALMADAVLCGEDGTPLARGADAIARFYAGIVRLHEDGTPRTQHVVANTAFDEPGPDGMVVATSTYVVLQAVPGLPLQPVITGTYVDTFAQDDTGRWRFTERRFGLGLTGSLQHHLAPGVLG